MNFFQTIYYFLLCYFYWFDFKKHKIFTVFLHFICIALLKKSPIFVV